MTFSGRLLFSSCPSLNEIELNIQPNEWNIPSLSPQDFQTTFTWIKLLLEGRWPTMWWWPQLTLSPGNNPGSFLVKKCFRSVLILKILAQNIETVMLNTNKPLKSHNVNYLHFAILLSRKMLYFFIDFVFAVGLNMRYFLLLKIKLYFLYS